VAAAALRDDAGLSGDGLYRYWLTRWDDGRGPDGVNFICLNPSTADALRDDPTVRRLRNFARAWGYGGFWLTNLYALRATNPRTLRVFPDPVGPENDAWLLSVARSAELVVCAWGAHAAPERAAAVTLMLSDDGIALWSLGETASGQPKHPLRLAGRTTPRRWRGLDQLQDAADA